MITVYHGSTFRVEYPLAVACRDNLDFGKGFYLTNMEEQAISWAHRVAIVKGEKPFLNIYDLDIDLVHSKYQVLTFATYNREWLRFVMDSRRGLKPWQDYDMIEGGIANDRIFNTVELYFTNLISEEEALKRLSYEQPNNQLCLISQLLIDTCLYFREAVKLKK